MALHQQTAGGGSKATFVEFSAKEGAFVRFIKDAPSEKYAAVSGELIDMYIADPMVARAGKPVPANADSIPRKLVVMLQEEGDRYAIQIPLNTAKDKAFSWTALKAIGTVYGAAWHSLMAQQANAEANAVVQPASVKFSAGKNDDGQPWLSARGGDNFDKKLDKGYGYATVDGVITMIDKIDEERFVVNVNDKNVIRTNEVEKLLQEMLTPFEQARAERQAAREAAGNGGGQQHGDDDSIDPNEMGHDAPRQR